MLFVCTNGRYELAFQGYRYKAKPGCLPGHTAREKVREKESCFSCSTKRWKFLYINIHIFTFTHALRAINFAKISNLANQQQAQQIKGNIRKEKHFHLADSLLFLMRHIISVIRHNIYISTHFCWPASALTLIATIKTMTVSLKYLYIHSYIMHPLLSVLYDRLECSSWLLINMKNMLRLWLIWLWMWVSALQWKETSLYRLINILTLSATENSCNNCKKLIKSYLIKVKLSKALFLCILLELKLLLIPCIVSTIVITRLSSALIKLYFPMATLQFGLK